MHARTARTAQAPHSSWAMLCTFLFYRSQPFFRQNRGGNFFSASRLRFCQGGDEKPSRTVRFCRSKSVRINRYKPINNKDLVFSAKSHFCLFLMPCTTACVCSCCGGNQTLDCLCGCGACRKRRSVTRQKSGMSPLRKKAQPPTFSVSRFHNISAEEKVHPKTNTPLVFVQEDGIFDTPPKLPQQARTAGKIIRNRC